MGKITELTQIKVQKSNVFYKGKKIGRWWGKTLYYFDPKSEDLHYRNFTLLGLFLHIFGYRKKYNKHGLNDWLKSKKVAVQSSKASEKTAIQGLTAFQNKKLEYKKLCLSDLPSGTYTIDDFKQHDTATTQAMIQLIQDLDVNTVLDTVNTTLLQEACCRGRYEVAKYLIEQGAEVNTETLIGSSFVARTPLQHAVGISYDKLTFLLLESGADVNSKNSNGSSVLHIAIDKLDKDPNIKHFTEQSKDSNPLEIIHELLLNGANVNTYDSNGKTPLYHACDKGNLDVVQLLINNKADVNAFGKYGDPPLVAAVQQKHVDIVRLLLDHGADPNLKDSLLVLAIGFEFRQLGTKLPQLNTRLIQLLIERGAEVNRVTEGVLKYYPLQLAIEYGDLEIVKLLVDAGADLDLVDYYYPNKNAIELARSENQNGIADFLEAQRKNI